MNALSENQDPKPDVGEIGELPRKPWRQTRRGDFLCMPVNHVRNALIPPLICKKLSIIKI
jgi:hypothetical protein